MNRHPYFDLWLHDDDELTTFTGQPIASRQTLHEWPLSCVQRITCSANMRYIYKVQAPPTVEPAFYQRAHSPLLVVARPLPTPLGPTALLLEDYVAVRLCDLALNEANGLTMVDTILQQIGQIDGDLPAQLEIRSATQWVAYGATIIEHLQFLVHQKRFHLLKPSLINHIATVINASTVLATFDGPYRLCARRSQRSKYSQWYQRIVRLAEELSFNCATPQ